MLQNKRLCLTLVAAALAGLTGCLAPSGTAGDDATPRADEQPNGGAPPGDEHTGEAKAAAMNACFNFATCNRWLAGGRCPGGMTCYYDDAGLTCFCAS